MSKNWNGHAPDPADARDLPEFIEALARLRMVAGAPSYRALAKLVGPTLRPPQVLAPTTLSDLFQSGRRRLDLDLVTATVRALGVSEQGVARWRAACVRVQAEARGGGPAGVFRQLPTELATFTGRDAELAGLMERVVSGPGDAAATTVVISAIEGMAGIGKTVFAVRAAHELLRAGRYADVQLYVNLRGFDPDHPPVHPATVLDSFLRQLGVPPRTIPESLDERAAMYRDRMTGREALILLDNAADEEQVRHLIPAAPGCLVLVTSRRSLAGLDGAAGCRLDTFSRDEALELLARLIGADRLAAEPEAGDAIVTACGLLPLAVTLAGARLKARPAWRLADLVARLHDGVLDAVATRNRALPPVFDLSYRGLPEQVRPLFPLLALHPGVDFTDEAAAALAGVGVARARRMLDLLLDEHLLTQSTPDRYQLHDLVRAYCLTLVDESPDHRRSEPVARLTTWYTHTALAADRVVTETTRDLVPTGAYDAANPPLHFGDRDEAFAWFDAEHANLLATAAGAAAAGLGTQAAELVFATSWFLRTRGYFSDWLNALRDVEGVTRSTGDPATVARLDGQLALVHSLLRRFDEATAYFQQSLDLRRSIGDRRGEATVLNSLGSVLDESGRPAEAVEYRLAARALYLELGDRNGEALALVNLAWSYHGLGRLAEAVEHGGLALKRSQDIGSDFAQSEALSGLGCFRLTLEEYDQAIDFLDQALALRRRAGNRYGEADTLVDLGHAHAGLGRTAEAFGFWQAAHAILVDIGHPRAAEAARLLTAATSADTAARPPSAASGSAPGRPGAEPGTQPVWRH